jgi:hypothetical protein
MLEPGSAAKKRGREGTDMGVGIVMVKTTM